MTAADSGSTRSTTHRALLTLTLTLTPLLTPLGASLPRPLSSGALRAFSALLLLRWTLSAASANASLLTRCASPDVCSCDSSEATLAR